ncbi:MAG: hypothetical protein ACRD36_04300 [Candidatus Acidiferrum sp.]
MAAFVLCTLLYPCLADAQLVPDNGLASNPPAAAKPASQEASGAAQAWGKRRVSQEIQLTGEEIWLDTGIDVKTGERVVITATGKLRYADQKADNGPEGLARGFKDLLRVLPFNEAGRGTLVGRIGDKDAAQPFLVGAKYDGVAPIDGRLSIGINQTSSDTGDGTYTARVEVFAPEGGTARVMAKQVTSLPGIDNALFAKIPRRIGDKEGKPGDMVNFLILGSEDAMKKVFSAAGWVHFEYDVK